MRIGIDSRCLRGGPEAFAGVAVAAWELLKALLQEDSSLELVLYPGFKAPRVWDPAGGLDEKRVTVQWNRLPDRLRRLVPGRIVPAISARSAGLDIFLGLDHVLPQLRGCAGCVVIHDLSYHRYPDHVDAAVLAHLRGHVPDAVRRAVVVFTPSSFTRREVVAVFGVPEDRVITLPWGISAGFKPVAASPRREAILKRHGLSPGYILAVGSLQPRKNIPHLLRTFLRWHGAHPGGPPLVLTGGITWKSGELLSEIEARAGAVVRLGHVPAEDLPAVYSAAGALVFPSLYEGFGFPILEAMACGTPVIASVRTSCPEVAGDAALYVDPEDGEALYGALSRILTDETLRASLVEQGFHRVKEYTWNRSARRYLEALRQAAAAGGD